MVGLVPTIHVFIPPTRVQDVDARHKGEHDGGGDYPTTFSGSTDSVRFSALSPNVVRVWRTPGMR